jgi:hypothetical protein
MWAACSPDRSSVNPLEGFAMRLWVLLSLLLVSGMSWAQNTSNPSGLEPIPDGSPALEENAQNVPAPAVTIRQLGARGSVEEYRAGGVLYMLKVVPRKGLPYYLVDTDGDGNLETRYNDLQAGMLIPAWVLLRW